MIRHRHSRGTRQASGSRTFRPDRQVGPADTNDEEDNDNIADDNTNNNEKRGALRIIRGPSGLFRPRFPPPLAASWPDMDMSARAQHRASFSLVKGPPAACR